MMLATIKGWYIRFGMFLTLFGVKWLALMMTHLHKVAKLPTIEEWEASKPKPEQTPAWLVLLDSWVAKAKVLTNELARMGKVGLISRADYTASEKSDHILKMEELPITEGDEVNDDADPMDPSKIPPEILERLRITLERLDKHDVALPDAIKAITDLTDGEDKDLNREKLTVAQLKEMASKLTDNNKTDSNGEDTDDDD